MEVWFREWIRGGGESAREEEITKEEGENIKIKSAS